VKRLRPFSFTMTPRGPCEMGPERPEGCTCQGCEPVVEPIVMPPDDGLDMAIELVLLEGRMR
jgi:hypothetical protein